MVVDVKSEVEQVGVFPYHCKTCVPVGLCVSKISCDGYKAF